MKLLNVVHNSKKDTGGKISHNLLMEELNERGHEISFLSTEDYEGFETYQMKDYMSVPILEIREKLVQKEIEKVLSKEDFDFIYSNGYYSTPPAIKAAEKFKAKSISHFRDYWYAEPKGTFVGDDGEYYEEATLQNIWKHNKKRRFAWNLYKYRYLKSRHSILNQSDFKIATSRTVQKRLNQCGIKDVEVIPNPVEVDKYKDRNGEKIREEHRIQDQFVATFIGTLSKHKGIKVIEQIIDKTDKEITFIIAGEGPEKERLEQKYRQNKNVILTGWLGHEKIPGLYDASNVILYPSIYPEGFGRIAVEAMASGTPIIASKRGGVKDIINNGKTGYLLNPESIEEWLKTIKSLRESPGQAETIKNNSLKDSQNYSRKKHVEKFENTIFN